LCLPTSPDPLAVRPLSQPLPPLVPSVIPIHLRAFLLPLLRPLLRPKLPAPAEILDAPSETVRLGTFRGVRVAVVPIARDELLFSERLRDEASEAHERAVP